MRGVEALAEGQGLDFGELDFVGAEGGGGFEDAGERQEGGGEGVEDAHRVCGVAGRALERGLVRIYGHAWRAAEDTVVRSRSSRLQLSWWWSLQWREAWRSSFVGRLNVMYRQR